MKIRMIIGVCGAIAIALLSTAYVWNINSDSKASGDNAVNVDFSEIRLSQDELIKDSDLIVRCIFNGEKETKRVSAKTKNSKGHEVTVKGSVTTYKMKSVENLKGSVNNEFEIGLMGSGDKNLEKGGEYVLFLDENGSDGRYRLVSYGQGFNKVKLKSSGSENDIMNPDSLDQPVEIETIETKEVMNYKDLKERIKELE
ncbi:MAG: hypothetical protein ACYDG2_19850 [Ruminiclostridium sp.]